MLIVSDTTPIIALMKAERLEILGRLFKEVHLPRAVHKELVANSLYYKEAKLIEECPFLRVCDAANIQHVSALRETMGLDAGESEAIALAMEQRADLLLIDERKGRQTAKRMGVRITGTVGVLLRAYDKGLLSREEVMGCMEKFNLANIRIGRELHATVVRHLRQK